MPPSFQVQGMRRLRGLGHVVPNFGISFHLREPWIWGYGYGMDGGWRGPGGYYRRAARPPLFIQCFRSFSPLCLFLLSTGCYLVSVVIVHSFHIPKGRVDSITARTSAEAALFNICYRPSRQDSDIKEVDAEHDRERKKNKRYRPRMDS